MHLDDNSLAIVDRALANLLKKPLCPAHKFQANEIRLKIRFHKIGVKNNHD